MSLWTRLERRLSQLAGDLLPDEFRAELDAARAELGRGEAIAAIAHLERLVAARPGHAGALALLGAARLAADEPAAASAEFERALALADDLPEALVGRGECELALGAPATALPWFRRAVDAAGGERAILAAAYRGLGLAHLAAGDADRAVRELRKAVAEAPGDPDALAGLGRAILAAPEGSPIEARRALARACEDDDAPAEAWLALAGLELDGGDAAAARAGFERAAARAATDEGRGPAWAGLAAVALAEDDAAQALAWIDRALALDPRAAAWHARRGDALADAARPADALVAYDRALTLADDDAIAGRALAAATACGDRAAAVRLANLLLARNPRDGQAVLARGRQLRADGDLAAARASFASALAEVARDAHHELADLELADPAGDPTAAAGHALAALRLDPAVAPVRDLLARARARELEVAAIDALTADDPAGFDRLVRLVPRILSHRPEWTAAATAARGAADELDGPLLVTVMGEFSSGKSTFINAIVGEAVAPTGITPTTATINLVKHGRERAGRIVYRDGRVAPLPWRSLLASLSALSGEDVRDIALVEILLPLPALERVSIVDTPGLNSILPEHEETARGFIGRADAVVWLFTAQQAGKASERAALGRIRGEGKRVLGVLNKIDQLSAAEVVEVTDHVRGELGSLLEDVVPVSARRALATPTDGNWPTVLAALEQRFFARAREIKREAASRRLDELLAPLVAATAARTGELAAASAALTAAAEAARAQATGFIDEVVAAERRELNREVTALYRGAAREVLELVRPRRIPFGSHKATRADRDYLLGLLASGLATALEHARARVRAALEQRTAAVLEPIRAALERTAAGAGHSQALADALRLVDARVFARLQAYVRGFLEGGAIDRFVSERLPKLELEEDAVYQAIFLEAPALDEPFAVPLAEAGAGVLAALADRLAAAAAELAADRHDAEVGAGRALAALSAARARLG